MKMKRIVAGIAAFILIGGLLTFANGLVGNPISRIIVNNGAKAYVERTYPDLNLSIGKAGYNFKNGAYSVQANSETSIDTHFSIEFTGTGKLSHDNYEDYVASKFNTWSRDWLKESSRTLMLREHITKKWIKKRYEISPLYNSTCMM